MKHPIKLFFCLVISTISYADAQESPKDAVERMAQMGAGVHDVKKDDTGVLQSLKVVGQERISKALGPAKGLMMAQKRASLKANAEFIEWMEKNVASVATRDDQTILILSGDGENVSEQGKSEEKTSEQITQVAQGVVKGLKLVGKDQDPKTGLLTLVYSWSPSGAQFANEAKQANNRAPADLAQPNDREDGKPSGEMAAQTFFCKIF